MDTFSNILIERSDNKFILFANADGKQWVMPVRNMSVAMNLYQPSSLKGKLIKSLLPYIYHLSIVKRVVGIEEIQVSLNPNLERLVKSIFNVSSFEFSVFGGTPSVHKKITIQISQQNKILGYCKVTDNNSIKLIFKHEQHVLNTLQNSNITQIPQCLYCGKLEEDTDLFVQTTCKSAKSSIVHNFTSRHWDFLSLLRNNSSKNILFSDSDFSRALISLKSNIESVDIARRDILMAAIVKVEEFYKDKRVDFSAYHGDFTPWNMFLERGKLFVFDFEYARLTYPNYLDWFHFFTQTAIFEKQLDTVGVYNAYKEEKKNISTYFNDPDFSYLCYLLSIIELYVSRESGELESDTLLKIEQWTILIDSLLKNK